MVFPQRLPFRFDQGAEVGNAWATQTWAEPTSEDLARMFPPSSAMKTPMSYRAWAPAWISTSSARSTGWPAVQLRDGVRDGDRGDGDVVGRAIEALGDAVCRARPDRKWGLGKGPTIHYHANGASSDTDAARDHTSNIRPSLAMPHSVAPVITCTLPTEIPLNSVVVDGSRSSAFRENVLGLVLGWQRVVTEFTEFAREIRTSDQF